MRLRKIASIGLAAICALSCVATVMAAERKDFRFVVLGKGKLARYKWAVTVERDEGRRGVSGLVLAQLFSMPNPRDILLRSQARAF